jgi:hypothetical protein
VGTGVLVGFGAGVGVFGTGVLAAEPGEVPTTQSVLTAAWAVLLAPDGVAIPAAETKEF